MKKTTVVSIVALMTLGGAVGVSAHDGGGMKEHMAKVDTNGDGAISQSEMMAKAKEKFSGFDKNGDGFIELAELPKEMKMPDHMKMRMKKHKEKMEKHKGDHGDAMSEGKDKKMHGKMKHKMKMGGKPSRMKFIAMLDKDGDERVSFEEFSAKPMKHFKKMDADGNGSVTPEEMAQMKDKMKSKMKNHHKGKGMKHMDMKSKGHHEKSEGDHDKSKDHHGG